MRELTIGQVKQMVAKPWTLARRKWRRACSFCTLRLKRHGIYPISIPTSIKPIFPIAIPQHNS